MANKIAFLLMCCFGIAGSCFAATGSGMAETQAKQQAYSVVSSYLTAWQKGDYNAMYALWDAKSRQAVTLDQLRHALTADVKGYSPNDVKLRQLLGGESQRPRARIASVVSIKAYPETTDYSTADYKVQVTFQSLNGVPFASLFPQALVQAKATDARTKRGDATLAIALFALSADKPEEISTLNNGFRAFTHGQDAEDKQGPYLTLYIHKYTLVKEQGQWRISNAMTVSDQLPTSPG